MLTNQLFPQQQQAIFPVLDFDFNNNIFDKMGNVFDSVGGLSYTSGKNDLALVFGGSSYIGAHVITPAMILGTDDFTVEFTTKPNTTSNAAILSNTNTGNIDGNYVIRALSNKVSLSYFRSGSWINHYLDGTFNDELHDIAIVRQDTAIKFIVDNVVEYIGSIPK